MHILRKILIVILSILFICLPVWAQEGNEAKDFLVNPDSYLFPIPPLDSTQFSPELSEVDPSGMTFVPVVFGELQEDDPAQNVYWYIALEDVDVCIEKKPGDPTFYRVEQAYRPVFLENLLENGLTQQIHGEERTILKFLCVYPGFYGGIYSEKLLLQTDSGDFVRYYHGDTFVDLTAQEEAVYWAAFEKYAGAYSTTHNFWGLPLNGVPSFVGFARNKDAENYQLTIFDYYPGWLNIPIFGALAVGLFLLIRRLFPDFGKTWKNMDPPERHDRI